MPLPTLNSFSPSTTAKSSEVNFNFTSIKNLIDAMRPTLYQSINGIVVVGTDVFTPIELAQEFTLVEVLLNVSSGNAPTGAALIVDILRNGSTIFSTKPQIDANQESGGDNAVFNTTTLSDGNILTYNIDQVGSTNNGSDLTIGLVFKY